MHMSLAGPVYTVCVGAVHYTLKVLFQQWYHHIGFMYHYMVEMEGVLYYVHHYQ